jgi:hypothetical protein
MKAEIGHWMFGAFDLHVVGKKWIGELMDNMNSAAFTSRIDNALKLVYQDKVPLVDLPPEVRVFMHGGLYYFSLKYGRGNDGVYPSYPEERIEVLFRGFEDLIRRDELAKNHFMAHVAERRLRERVIKAFKDKHITFQDVHRLYREMGYYIALISLGIQEDNSDIVQDKILKKIADLDLEAIGAA